MIDTAAKVMEELRTTEQSSSLSLEVDSDSYLEVIKGIMTSYPSGEEQLIYITATVSAESIIQAMELIGVDVSEVKFIDCITNITTGSQSNGGNITHIESPTMLESIMLKVEFIRKKVSGKRIMVVLDSLNTLHIHNDWKILGEFLHILVNTLKSKGATVIILSVREQQSPELSMLLGLVSDRMVRIGVE